MWAVVEIKNKQYIVNEGDTIRVEKLKAKEKAISFGEVLLVADGEDVAVGTPYVKNARVKAEVLGEEKGDKVLVYKVKRRKKYRKKQGHRQVYTLLKISNITS